MGDEPPGRMDPEQCPECGAHESIVLVGTRIDRPQRWLPWRPKLGQLYTVTYVYLCNACGAVSEVAEIRKRRPQG